MFKTALHFKIKAIGHIPMSKYNQFLAYFELMFLKIVSSLIFGYIYMLVSVTDFLFVSKLEFSTTVLIHLLVY